MSCSVAAQLTWQLTSKPCLCTPQELLTALELAEWETLARRRVAHFGHRFSYEVCNYQQLLRSCFNTCQLVEPQRTRPPPHGAPQIRGVDRGASVPQFPAVITEVVQRIQQVPHVGQQVDQLTVNEYEAGVGLAPHVDTHSAFEGTTHL